MPNLDNGPQYSLYVVAVVFLVLTTFFVVLRFWAKQMKKLPWALDDGLLFAGLLSFYALATVKLLALFVGSLGTHIDTLTPGQASRTIMLLWCSDFPYALTMTFARLSMTVLLLRIFRHTAKNLKKIVLVCVWLSIAWCLAYVILPCVRCRPFKYNWMSPPEDVEHCFRITLAQTIVISFGFVIDITIWSIPHFVVWRLRLRLAHKIALTVLFSLGIINVVIGIFRVVFLAGLDYHRDVTYEAAQTSSWGIAKCGTALILVCCPLLRPVLEALIPGHLIKIYYSKPHHTRSSRSKIRATTRIDVLDDSRSQRANPMKFMEEVVGAPKFVVLQRAL